MGLGRAAAELAKAGWAPPNPGQTLGELSNPAALSTAPHQAPSPPVGDGITFTSSPSNNQIFAGYVTHPWFLWGATTTRGGLLPVTY